MTFFYIVIRRVGCLRGHPPFFFLPLPPPQPPPGNPPSFQREQVFRLPPPYNCVTAKSRNCFSPHPPFFLSALGCPLSRCVLSSVFHGWRRFPNFWLCSRFVQMRWFGCISKVCVTFENPAADEAPFFLLTPHPAKDPTHTHTGHNNEAARMRCSRERCQRCQAAGTA